MVLIARSGSMQGDDVMNSANAAVGYFYKKQNAVAYYFGLRSMNDSLLSENVRLRNLLAADRYSTDTFRDSTAVISRPGIDSLHPTEYARYTFRQARVINNSVSLKNNFITLNRGSKDGIKPEMAVISGTGVVGRVMNVSDHFCTVLSVLSETRPVSGRLSDGTTKTVNWKSGSPDELLMADVALERKIKRGDSIVTNTYSFFPPDVLIGTIRSIDTNRQSNTYLLHLKPGTNFRNLQYVYVVENSYQAERTELEKRSKVPTTGN